MDGQWYSYDDSSAEAVPEAEVCTRGAYILFYQRKNTIPSWSASSSVTGSSIVFKSVVTMVHKTCFHDTPSILVNFYVSHFCH